MLKIWTKWWMDDRQTYTPTHTHTDNQTDREKDKQIDDGWTVTIKKHDVHFIGGIVYYVDLVKK